MNKEELTKKIEDIKLSKKDFADLANISYNTVNNWNDTNKPVPSWVESWLNNYEKAKTYNDVKEKIFKIEGVK